MRWNILQAKKQSFEVNGHQVDGTMTIQWDYDDCAPEFDSGVPEYDAQDRADYESGKVQYIVISVIARAEGLEGIDTLGMVAVRTAHFDADLMEVAQTHGMTDNARDTLQNEIMDAATRLQKYARKAA